MLGFVRDMISTWAALRGPELPRGSWLEEVHIGPMVVVLTIPKFQTNQVVWDFGFNICYLS